MIEIAVGLGGTAGVFLFLAIVVGTSATNSGIGWAKREERTTVGWLSLGAAVVIGLAAIWVAVLG